MAGISQTKTYGVSYVIHGDASKLTSALTGAKEQASLLSDALSGARTNMQALFGHGSNLTESFEKLNKFYSEAIKAQKSGQSNALSTSAKLSEDLTKKTKALRKQLESNPIISEKGLIGANIVKSIQSQLNAHKFGITVSPILSANAQVTLQEQLSKLSLTVNVQPNFNKAKDTKKGANAVSPSQKKVYTSPTAKASANSLAQIRQELTQLQNYIKANPLTGNFRVNYGESRTQVQRIIGNLRQYAMTKPIRVPVEVVWGNAGGQLQNILSGLQSFANGHGIKTTAKVSGTATGGSTGTGSTLTDEQKKESAIRSAARSKWSSMLDKQLGNYYPGWKEEQMAKYDKWAAKFPGIAGAERLQNFSENYRQRQLRQTSLDKANKQAERIEKQHQANKQRVTDSVMRDIEKNNRAEIKEKERLARESQKAQERIAREQAKAQEKLIKEQERAAQRQAREQQRAQRMTNGKGDLYTRMRKSWYPFTGNTSFGARTPMALDMAKGMGMMFAVSGVMQAVTSSFHQVAEYENMMKTVQAILKTNDGGANFNGRFRAMEEEVRRVGRETKFTAPEVAGAARFMAMAGLGIEDINAATNPIANLALVGDNDMSTTADKMTNIMTSFGLLKGLSAAQKKANMRHTSDILTNTFTKSNTDLMQLAEAMQYAGPMSHLTGTSLEDAAAMVGVMGNAGIQSSMAGTTLRMMYQNIIKPNKKQATEWKRLGINTKDDQGRNRDIFEILKDLRAKITGTTDLNSKVGADQLKIMGAEVMSLFRTTAGAGTAALLENLGEAINLAKSNRESNGVAQTIADEKKNTISGLWAQVTSTFTDQSVNTVNEFVETIKDMLRSLRDWLASKEAADTLRSIYEVGKDIILVFKDVAKAWKAIYNFAPGLVKTFVVIQLWATQIGYLATPIIQVVGAISTLKNALFAFARMTGIIKTIDTGAAIASATSSTGATAVYAGSNIVNNASKSSIKAAGSKFVRGVADIFGMIIGSAAYGSVKFGRGIGKAARAITDFLIEASGAFPWAYSIARRFVISKSTRFARGVRSMGGAGLNFLRTTSAKATIWGRNRLLDLALFMDPLVTKMGSNGKIRTLRAWGTTSISGLSKAGNFVKNAGLTSLYYAQIAGSKSLSAAKTASIFGAKVGRGLFNIVSLLTIMGGNAITKTVIGLKRATFFLGKAIAIGGWEFLKTFYEVHRDLLIAAKNSKLGIATGRAASWLGSTSGRAIGWLGSTTGRAASWTGNAIMSGASIVANQASKWFNIVSAAATTSIAYMGNKISPIWNKGAMAMDKASSVMGVMISKLKLASIAIYDVLGLAGGKMLSGGKNIAKKSSKWVWESIIQGVLFAGVGKIGKPIKSLFGGTGRLLAGAGSKIGGLLGGLGAGAMRFGGAGFGLLKTLGGGLLSLLGGPLGWILGLGALGAGGYALYKWWDNKKEREKEEQLVIRNATETHRANLMGSAYKSSVELGGYSPLVLSYAKAKYDSRPTYSLGDNEIAKNILEHTKLLEGSDIMKGYVNAYSSYLPSDLQRGFTSTSVTGTQWHQDKALYAKYARKSAIIAQWASAAIEDQALQNAQLDLQKAIVANDSNKISRIMASFIPNKKSARMSSFGDAEVISQITDPTRFYEWQYAQYKYLQDIVQYGTPGIHYNQALNMLPGLSKKKKKDISDHEMRQFAKLIAGSFPVDWNGMTGQLFFNKAGKIDWDMMAHTLNNDIPFSLQQQQELIQSMYDTVYNDPKITALTEVTDLLKTYLPQIAGTSYGPFMEPQFGLDEDKSPYPVGTENKFGLPDFETMPAPYYFKPLWGTLDEEIDKAGSIMQGTVEYMKKMGMTNTATGPLSQDKGKNNNNSTITPPSTDQSAYDSKYNSHQARPTQIIFNIDQLCKFEGTQVNSLDQKGIAESVGRQMAEGLHLMFAQAASDFAIIGDSNG